MFDIKWIRDNPEQFDRGLTRRGLKPLSAQVLDLDRRRREALSEAQAIQTRRNRLAKDIGAAKGRGEDVTALLDEVAADKEDQADAEEHARQLGEQLEGRSGLLMSLPNPPADDVPDGPDEGANRELRRWGEPPAFDFAPKEHDDLGVALGLMDFESAAKLSGTRFVVLKGALARLERALAAFMLDLHTTEFGYTEVNPPALVRDEAMFGTGQLPKFEIDLFQTTTVDAGKLAAEAEHRAEKIIMDMMDRGAELDGLEGEAKRKFLMFIKKQTSFATMSNAVSRRYWLIPTAEVPLTNMVADEILPESSLPRRSVAKTWCFRSEAGAAGKDTRGMIRQHQFTKVELVSIAHPDHSAAEHERMTACAEEVLKRLKLPYRVVLLCTGDMGFSACKTYDIEVWLPGQGRYREISSCSNCGDFQARRMKARFKSPGDKGTRFVHTLNGSGLAVGRTLVAVLENYQRADGSVVVPEALRPYMGGLEVVTPHV
ncbi:MAG: serine--tRNA ligase [Alphaproteobacteria bacterium]